MEKNAIPFFVYSFYLAITVVWISGFIVAPLLALAGEQEISDALYSLYAPACHQQLTRSLCFFSDGGFGDCITDKTKVGAVNPATGRRHSVTVDGVTGYAIAVCARDAPFYTAMLIGGLVLPLFRRIEERDIPPFLYFVLALIPIGIDGTGQLIGFWESTNLSRVVTGAIAGFVVPFYLLPILNKILQQEDG